MNEYRVNLDVFAGPLDLLLYLVRKEEVDIYDIPIARVTAQYVEYIQMMQSLDIDLAGDFLIMAATLMEIKSAMLLPRTEAESTEQTETGDPRAELVRQLLEYKRIKDAANLLAGAAQQRQQRFTRPDTILSSMKNTSEPELDLDQVSIWTLLEAFDSIMKATGHTSSYSRITDETPIDLYQIEVLHRLQVEGPLTFEKVFQGKTNKLVMIGLFLAMLELMRNQLIRVEQTEIKGPIYLTALTDRPAEQAVQQAILSRIAVEQQSSGQQELDREDLQTEEELAENTTNTLSDHALADEDDILDDDDPLLAELKTIDIPELSDKPSPQPRIRIQEIPAESNKNSPSKSETLHTEEHVESDR
ncbi:MAG: segregation/condensation protein A [Sedimentisphaerales bacterium]|nr:segregation/condensation protein A [Sedimentisphaerales bacterium]